MRNGMESEKEAITRELNASREAVEAEKAAMKAEVQAEKEKAEALKNKYKQQINAMEEEFAEIKTNILRTAGRVDSLKSKLADDEGSVWTVNDTPEAVDFPVICLLYTSTRKIISLFTATGYWKRRWSGSRRYGYMDSIRSRPGLSLIHI